MYGVRGGGVLRRGTQGGPGPRRELQKEDPRRGIPRGLVVGHEDRPVWDIGSV